MSLSCFLCYFDCHSSCFFFFEFFLLDFLEEPWFPSCPPDWFMPLSGPFPCGPPLPSLWHLTRSATLWAALSLATTLWTTALRGPPSCGPHPVGHHFSGFVKHGHFDYFVADWILGSDPFGPVEKIVDYWKIVRRWHRHQSHFQHQPTIHQLLPCHPPLRASFEDNHFFLILAFRQLVLFLFDSSFYLYLLYKYLSLKFKGSSIL